MPKMKTCLVLLFLSFAATAELCAQGARYLIPERIERATEKGDDGQLKWAEWKELECPTCKGAGKTTCATCARFPKDDKNCPECKRNAKLEAVCRVCAGKGKIPDPLDSAPCAGCMGAAFLPCLVCSGRGEMRVNGAKRPSKCPSCRGDGGFDCGACKGQRVLGPLVLKPSLREAPLDKLQKAQEALEESMKRFAAFEPKGGTKARNEVKELGKAYDALKKFHPAFKGMAKATKNYMSKILGGAQFQGHEQNEANAMNLLKSNAEYYLKHQKRMLELAIQRAEANEKAGK